MKTASADQGVLSIIEQITITKFGNCQLFSLLYISPCLSQTGELGLWGHQTDRQGREEQGVLGELGRMRGQGGVHCALLRAQEVRRSPEPGHGVVAGGGGGVVGGGAAVPGLGGVVAAAGAVIPGAGGAIPGVRGAVARIRGAVASIRGAIPATGGAIPTAHPAPIGGPAPAVT